MQRRHRWEFLRPSFADCLFTKKQSIHPEIACVSIVLENGKFFNIFLQVNNALGLVEQIAQNKKIREALSQFQYAGIVPWVLIALPQN